MFLRKLYYLFPPSIRLIIRRIYYFPIDLYEKVTGKRDNLTPPRGLVFVGYGDFKKTGETLINHVTTHCKLKHNSEVLDIGCGIGRLAVPLTKILSREGRYEGFDIVKQGISWCNRHIKPSYPNFNFMHINLKNDLYNLKTSCEARNFVFPYENNQFDVVISTSVFTHMIPDDVANYLGEIKRVMKNNGKCFATFFLLNNEIKEIIDRRGYFNFPYRFGNYSLLDKNVKEANVAFEEKYLVNELLAAHNLKAENIYYGWWPGKPKETSLGYQDTIIITANG
ncbi:MAG: class I SAM-dependent methyltransferase [Bacteroidales bacterium]